MPSQGIFKKVKISLYKPKRLCYTVKVMFRGIAQLVEQRSPKPRAVSSSLTTPVKQKGVLLDTFFVLDKDVRLELMPHASGVK